MVETTRQSSIVFFAEGRPISQGSKSAWCPTRENEDIEHAIRVMRSIAESGETPAHTGRELNDAATRLMRYDQWPIFMEAKDPAKRGRWLATMRESSDKTLRPWRKAIARAAKKAYHGLPVACPVLIDLEFWFHRPKSHYGTGKNAAVLKKSAPKYHTQTPDEDKLRRAVLDALTGVIFQDDKQSIGGQNYKSWRETRDQPEGVEVTVFVYPED